MIKWAQKNWGTYRWNTIDLDDKWGLFPVEKVELILDSGVYNITKYYKGGAYFDQQKEEAPDVITSGDITLNFTNYDNYFSERDSTSVLYERDYFNKKIKFYSGLKDSDGIIEYRIQATVKIKSIELKQESSMVYFYCEDLSKKMIEERLHIYPLIMAPIAGTGNIGNGTCSSIVTKPFIVINESWVLTCTLAGGDATATFSVVGSVTGTIGTAISGTEFSKASIGGIKFTVKAGGIVWALNDTFTFSTKKYPQWDNVSPAEIIWGILTGYNYDTNTQEDWYESSLKLDHTKSSGNIDLDYSSFVEAINNIDSTLNLTGYISYNKNCAEAIQDIIIHFLGAVTISPEGKVKLHTWKPSFGELSLREFSDAKKIVSFGYKKNISDIINVGTIEYKRTKTWAWSNEDETTDGVYTSESSDSITKYGMRKTFVWTSYWYSTSDAAAEWLIDRLISKFQNPPLTVGFGTGTDALETELGDRIWVTNEKSKLFKIIFEVDHIQADFGSKPRKITIEAIDTGTTGLYWCFLGSGVDESDGISPQTSSYDGATDTDKQFCYLSTSGSSVSPLYYLW